MKFNVPLKFGLSLFAIIGIGMLSLMGKFLGDARAFMAMAIPTQATITGYSESYDAEDGLYTYTPQFTFELDGDTIEGAGGFGSSNRPYDIGDTVDILYNPNDPDDATIDSFMNVYGGVLFSGILGGAFFLAGGIPIFYMWHRKRVAAHLKATGHKIQAKITEIPLRMNMKINGRHPYRIFAEGMNPTTNKKQTFISRNIMHNPEGQVAVGDMIDIYIDSATGKKYWVDITFLDSNS